jgi:hypothetical protein
MLELTLQVEESKYNQLLQFLNTIDYIKILTQLQQSNTADTQKKVSSNTAPTKQKNKKNNTPAPINPAEERAAKIAGLWGSISKEAGEELLRQTAEMRNEWDRQF